MVVECKICKKLFKFQCHLTRHLNRKNPCEFISEDDMILKRKNICCKCNKEFSSANSLLKHKNIHCPAVKKLAASEVDSNNEEKATNSIINGNVNNTVNNGTINNTVNNTVKIKIVSRPGWNLSFPEPSCAVPFPGVVLSSEILSKALNTLSANEQQRTSAGDVDTINKFHMNLLEIVHSCPEYQNVFNNPNRCDQLLILGNNLWKCEHINKVLSQLNANVSDEITSKQKLLHRDINLEALSSAAQVIRSKIIDKAECSKMNSHLTNMQNAYVAGGKLLTEIADIKSFNLRTDDHIPVSSLCILICSSSIKLLSAKIADEKRRTPGSSELAHKALRAFVALSLRDHIENLNFVPVRNEAGRDVVYIKYDEWEVHDRDEAIARLSKRYLKIICEYLRSRDGDHLIELADHIESIIDSQVQSEVSHGRILEEYYDFMDSYEPLIKNNIKSFPMLS